MKRLWLILKYTIIKLRIINYELSRSPNGIPSGGCLWHEWENEIQITNYALQTIKLKMNF